MAEKKKLVSEITSMDVDFAQWYTDIVKKAEMADYSSVKGCIIMRPYAQALWENIQHTLDGMFKETGHENVAMPIFIPESLLQKEADHVEGFAPECAWVTHGGNDKLEVRFEALKDASLPAMLTVSEQSRRMEEMMKLYAMQTGGKEQAPLFPLEYTLLLNTASPLISKLTALVAEGAPEDASGKAELIAEQIWRLSVLAQRKFTADELKNFLAGSFDILTKL